MKTLFLLLAVTALAGCSFSAYQNGETRALNSRWFWQTEGFRLETGTNGTTLELQRSNPDAETLRAVAAGLAEGAVKGAAPVP